MRSKKGKIIIFIVVGMVLIFLFYNIVWILWSHLKYDSFTKGMKPFIKNSSYVLEGADGYLYNVKYPDYLQMGGNMCVATQDEKYALLIWPRIIGGYDYGVQIEAEGTLYSILVTPAMQAIDEKYEDILSPYQETIHQLNEKAHQMWAL